jgi:hypothetical protein
MKSDLKFDLKIFKIRFENIQNLSRKYLKFEKFEHYRHFEYRSENSKNEYSNVFVCIRPSLEHGSRRL